MPKKTVSCATAGMAVCFNDCDLRECGQEERPELAAIGPKGLSSLPTSNVPSKRFFFFGYFHALAADFQSEPVNE